MRHNSIAETSSTEFAISTFDSNIGIWVGDGVRDAIQPARHILCERLVANEITALYGEPKTGKTFIAVACAVSCVVGGEFWGHKFPEGGSVVYVAAERHEQAAERIRAQFQQVGFDHIPDTFVLVGGEPTIRLSNTPLISQLKTLISIVNPSLVVFDTYVRMTENDEDNSRDTDNNIFAFTQIIRSSNRPCAGLLVHHRGKDPSRKMRGSSALLAAVTTVWKVEKKAKGRTLVLSMEDANSIALAEPCYFEIVQSKIRLGYENLDVGVVAPTDAPARTKSRRDCIIEALSESNPRGLAISHLVAEVRRATGSGSDSAVRRDLENLIEEGYVAEKPAGKKRIYCLNDSNFELGISQLARSIR